MGAGATRASARGVTDPIVGSGALFGWFRNQHGVVAVTAFIRATSMKNRGCGLRGRAFPSRPRIASSFDELPRQRIAKAPVPAPSTLIPRTAKAPLPLTIETCLSPLSSCLISSSPLLLPNVKDEPRPQLAPKAAPQPTCQLWSLALAPC